MGKKLFMLFFLVFFGIFAFHACDNVQGYSLKSTAMPYTANIVNADYVPAPRHLKSTKWNYFYSFAVLTQKDWYAATIADNLLRACESNDVDSYITARKVWRETHFQVIQISYLPERLEDEKGNYILDDDSNFIIVTNRCAYGIMQVNLRRHKQRLIDYRAGILKPLLNCYADYEREILLLDVNVDIGTGIFKDYLKMFNGRADYAICAYFAGENSIHMRNIKNGIGNDYVNWIMDERKALADMTLYTFYNPETTRSNKWRYIDKRDESFFETNGGTL